MGARADVEACVSEKRATGVCRRCCSARSSSIRVNVEFFFGATMAGASGCSLLYLIHIAGVAFCGFERLNVGGGLLRRFASGSFDNLMQSSVYILRHPSGIAAHIKMCALLEPRI